MVIVVIILIIVLAAVLPGWGLLLIGGGLLVCAICGFAMSVQDASKSDEEKEEDKFYSVKSLQTVGKIARGEEVKLKLDSKMKKIRKLKDTVDINIPYERIKGFWVENETTLAKSSNGIDEAIIGGLLFGGAGAVVGGMSGKGNTERRWYATLSYEDKNGKASELFFQEMGLVNEYKGATKSEDAKFFERRIQSIIKEYQISISEL